jgi:hypothetical protein
MIKSSNIHRTLTRSSWPSCVHLGNLLHNYSPISQMINHYPVTRVQIQPISYSWRKLNPTVSIDFCNHSRTRSVSSNFHQYPLFSSRNIYFISTNKEETTPSGVVWSAHLALQAHLGGLGLSSSRECNIKPEAIKL